MAYRDFPCFEAILWSGENSIGPRTFCGAKSRVYDGFNRLRQVRKGGTTAQYTYNAEGIRTAKTVNGETTSFILDGANVIGEVNPQNQVTNYIRGASGVILSKDPSNVMRYYVTNGHGDVTGLTDTSGTVIKSYTYDAFGIEQNIDSNDTNPFRYCGEYFDSETQSIYLRARYYSPVTGRFGQQDTYWNPDNMIYGSDGNPSIAAITQSNNLYVYCMNNPVNLLDRLGFKAGDEFNSPDEAAIDWAKTYYGVTDYVLMEQASVIFEYTDTDENGNTVKKYSYTEPVVGGPYSVQTNLKDIPMGTKAVAQVHSHSMISEFSDTDKEYAKKCGVSNYLVMPSSEGNADVYKYADQWGEWGESPVAYNVKFNELSDVQKQSLVLQYEIVWKDHLEHPHGDGIGECNVPCSERRWPREGGTD